MPCHVDQNEHNINLVTPPNELLSTAKGSKKSIVWNDEAIAAFSDMKEALAKAALLAHPKPDAFTSIITDASDIAVGAILQQRIENSWCPIAYLSRKLKPSERHYSTFDRELLAVYLAIKHFSHFVEGRIFHILIINRLGPIDAKLRHIRNVC